MMRLLSFVRFGSAACLVAAIGAGGCASNPTSVDDEDDVTEDAAALEDAAKVDGDEAATAKRDGREGLRGRGGRGGRHGGPEMALFRAAEDLDLGDAQRASIDEARAAMEPARDAQGPSRAMVAKLAAAVRKGAVDVAALTPTDASDPMAGHRARSVAGIQKLHDTLTPAQRAEVVAAVQAKMAEHGGPPPGAEKSPPDGGRGGPAAHLLRDLDVSDAQRAKITAALDDAGLGASSVPGRPDFAAMRGQAEAALKAFATDGFDADAALPTPPARAAFGGPAAFVKSLAVIVPLLDADQREALAAQLERGPRDPRGPRGWRDLARE